MNSPKEKAEELFTKFYMLFFDEDGDISEEINISLLSIKSAVITVNEIIEWSESLLHAENTFWREVKEELLKM